MSADEATAPSEEESAAPTMPEPDTELMFGAGQSAWLAVISVGVILALAVSFVALFMAVNADDGGGGAAAPTGPATSLTVEASDFAFDPARALVVADTDVEVSLDNVGAVQHNWSVLPEGATIGDEAEIEGLDFAAQIETEPGASSSGSVNLPAGSYQVICTIAGHFSAGMEGTLEVAS